MNIGIAWGCFRHLEADVAKMTKATLSDGMELSFFLSLFSKYIIVVNSVYLGNKMVKILS